MRHAWLIAVALAATTMRLCLAEDQAPPMIESRSLGEMTVEERMRMMKSASKFDNCVYAQAISKVGDFPDIRQAVDFALGKCQTHLAELEAKITSMGFAADYAHAFVNRIRSRAVRNILPVLAIRKSDG